MNAPLAPQVTSHSQGRARITVPLRLFFAAAFLIAWAAWIPLFTMRSLPGQIAFIGLFAPAIAGFAIAALSGGRRSVRDIVRRLTIVRFPIYWLLLSALLMPAIYVATIGVLRALKRGGSGPLFTGNSPLFLVAGFVWLLFVNSGEELGWRGYALPRLLERFDRPVLVALGLGVVWGVWHLPLYLLPGQSAFPFPLFVVFTTLQSVIYMVVFLRTKGSLVPALLLHAGTDIAPRVIQLAHLPVTFWVVVDGMMGVVVMLLLLGMRRQLSSFGQWRTEIMNPAAE